MTLSQAFLLTVKKQKECRAAAAGTPGFIAFCIGVFALFFAALKIFDLGSGAAFVLLVLFFGLLFWVPAKLKSIGKAQDEYNDFIKKFSSARSSVRSTRALRIALTAAFRRANLTRPGFIGRAHFTAKIACAASIKASNLVCAR